MMNKDKMKLISVISGKGGTGKTLLSAVLGNALSKRGCKVLLVDLDIHVRGLTILLSEYLKISDLSKRTVSDLMQHPDKIDTTEEKSKLRKKFRYVDDDVKHSTLSIFRFEECDFLPSVKNIDEPLNYDEYLYNSEEISEMFFERIMPMLQEYHYDIVIFDCRAGIDGMVLAVSKVCDCIISVAEDDDVCLQTNNNVINHLKYKEALTDVYTIINKARRVKDADELNLKMENGYKNYGISVIPFDMEVMEDFGKNRFWHNLTDTLYFYAVCKAWNKIASKVGTVELKEDKFSILRRNGRLSFIQRVFRLYSIGLTVGGISILLYRLFLGFDRIDSFLLVGLISIIMGAFTTILSNTNIRQILFGKYDYPKKK